MQNEEQKYAKELNEKFKIPYIVITHKCTGEEFTKELQRIGDDSIE